MEPAQEDFSLGPPSSWLKTNVVSNSSTCVRVFYMHMYMHS